MFTEQKLSISIVSYNTRELTIATVESVVDSGAQIIVVDNDSRDDTLIALKKEFGSKIKIISNKENIGFARANNQGVREATGKYILLLNSDTIVHAGALQKMMEALEGDPQLGMAAATLINKDGSYQPQGGALPTLLNITAWALWPLPGLMPGVKPYQDPSPVSEHGWVAGTAVMLRKSEYEAIGGLDEKIFMYAEDIDFCFRLHAKGMRVMIVPEALVTHLGSASSSSRNARQKEIEGLKYFFKKHKPAWQTPLLTCVLTSGCLLRYLLFDILSYKRQ